jgi:hypothetical protein
VSTKCSMKIPFTIYHHFNVRSYITHVLPLWNILVSGVNGTGTRGTGSLPKYMYSIYRRAAEMAGLFQLSNGSKARVAQ